MPYFVASDGTRLHYTDEGDGKPVLCLAGLTRNGRDFDHVAPHLKGVRLIRPDYRGRALSDWADPATYTVSHEASDVVALLDHLMIERAAVIGTSRGGIIGMWLGRMARHRLTGVALNDIGPEVGAKGLEIIKSYLGRNPGHQTWEEAARVRGKHWTGFRDVPHERWLAEVMNHYEETPEGLAIRYDPRLRDAVFGRGAQPSPDLWPLFDKLAGLPFALIRGETSELLTRATAAEMVRRRPDMLFAEVPGRGHVPFLDEPGALAVLHRWLEMIP